MNSGPACPFVSVKSSPVGRTYSFLLPELALDAESDGAADATPPPAPFVHGDAVIVQTPEGRALGTVTRTLPALSDRRQPPQGSDAHVVRRATREDVVVRLKQKQREQEAHRKIGRASCRGRVQNRERGVGV